MSSFNSSTSWPVPGPISTFLGVVAYNFTLVQPLLPTYMHLVVSALLPIYAGAHASLTRPSSAAKPSKKTSGSRRDKVQAGLESQNAKMEGLTPMDALMYPVLSGSLLAGLYVLIKWMDDPDLINKILNYYLSIFGLFSVSKFIFDVGTTVESFVWPQKYASGGRIWEAKEDTFVAGGVDGTVLVRTSPLPGFQGRVPLPSWVKRSLWSVRGFSSTLLFSLEAYIHGVFALTATISLRDVFTFTSAVTAVWYFNVVDKPWYLTNLLAFSFSYTALLLMSPTTFWTGTLVLTALFFYDIYFVFYTPMMITVAKSLDVPVKLLFPRPQIEGEKPGAMAMLGLGDVVLPGIMIGLALRFDLYLFYLKKQTRILREDGTNGGAIIDSGESQKQKGAKAVYRPATGNWGERFWLGSGNLDGEGGAFPKIYFYAGICGYIVGIVCTIGVMHVYQHGQPALLYLVPSVLLSIWGTALGRGEIKQMWNYTEAEEETSKIADKAREETSKTTDKTQEEASKITDKAKEETSKTTDKAKNEEQEKTKERGNTGQIDDQNGASIEQAEPGLVVQSASKKTSPKKNVPNTKTANHEDNSNATIDSKYADTWLSLSITSPKTSQLDDEPAAELVATPGLRKETGTSIVGQGFVDGTDNWTPIQSSAETSPVVASSLDEDGTPMVKRRRVD